MKKTEFPPGFESVDQQGLKDNVGYHPKPLMITIAKNGYVIFNVPTTVLIFDGGKNTAVAIATNTKKNLLAFKPERVHRRPPATYKLSTVGGYKRHVSVAFKTLSRIWNIPLNGKRYYCKWDEKLEILTADLNAEI